METASAKGGDGRFSPEACLVTGTDGNNPKIHPIWTQES
jgi:hypothetical protein